MLRGVVPCARAIDVSVSPGLTTYARNVGCGVGVGRTNDGGAPVATGSEGDGRRAPPDGGAVSLGGARVSRRLVAGMQPPAVTAMAVAMATSGVATGTDPRILSILPQQPGFD
jgi:hypothetical protein